MTTLVDKQGHVLLHIVGEGAVEKGPFVGTEEVALAPLSFAAPAFNIQVEVLHRAMALGYPFPDEHRLDA